MGPLRLPVVIILALAACSATEQERPGDVLLISVDTLRPDHMSAHGYGRPTTPQLERWFEAGARFSRAYSTAASTPPGVVSILTGLLPQDHGVRTF